MLVIQALLAEPDTGDRYGMMQMQLQEWTDKYVDGKIDYYKRYKIISKCLLNQ